MADTSFRRQIALEIEGAAAALKGVARDAGPYPDQSFEWNHWVFGHDCALSERLIVNRGYVDLCSTSDSGPTLRLSVDDAIRQGLWRPRFTVLGSSSS